MLSRGKGVWGSRPEASGFALVQNYPYISPHFVILSSFLKDKTAWNEGKMTRMSIE